MTKLIPLLLTSLIFLLASTQSAVITATTVNGLPNAALETNRIYIVTDGISASDCSQGGGSYTVFCRSNGAAWTAIGNVGNGGGILSGYCCMMVFSGGCPVGWSEVTELNGRTLIGTLAANGNAGATGGSDTVTPAGIVSAPLFTGTPFTSIINHTHSITVNDPGHAHVQGVNSATTGTLSGYAPDTSSNTRVNSGYSTSTSTTGITASSTNPSGGIASITPAGAVSQPTFTGAQFDNRSAFLRCIYCRKD